MTPGLHLRLALREARGQGRRMAFFVACLAVGVAAVVAVAGLSAGLDRAIRRQARQLLAADLVVEGRRPLPPAVDRALDALPGARRADVKEMVTIVAAPEAGGRPGASRLAELKAVAPGYPFYGRLRLSPQRPHARLLDAESAVAAPELLAALGLAVGDRLRIGGESFRVAAALEEEPDRIAGSLSLGPRVMVSLAGLERAGLERRGSRISYRALVALAPETGKAELAQVVRGLEAEIARAGGGHRIETYALAQPALRQGLARAERFLGLVALLSLLVGGVGIAQTAQAWLAGRLDGIAVLKCLGMRPREILGLYLGQTALLGLAGSLAGAAAGSVTLLLVPPLAGDLLPAAAIDPWQPAAVARGVALGVGMALLASLPSLAALLRVPPARVLRRDAEPLPAHRLARWGTAAVLAAGVTALAVSQSGSLALGAAFTAGLGLLTAVLAAAALAASRLARRRPRSGGRIALRHGLTALARPGAATLGAVVALGLGVSVVLGMALVEDHLRRRLAADLPRDAPTAFLIDIQPDQWPAVEQLLARQGAARIDSVPVVTARLAAVDGRSARELAGASDERSRRWALTREQRLTYLAELPPGNRVVAGAWWSDPARGELSVEEEFARELGAAVGSVLRFDVQGVEVEVAVTSLRAVDWESFGINFFLVAEPGVLDGAPQQRVAAARLPAGREQEIQDRLVAAFPNVTLLDVRQILDKVLAVLTRLGLGVRLLGGFTVVAGIAILAGAVSAGAARRGREVALLKTLGMTRLGVASTFAVEYSLLGSLAGVIGAGGGGVLAWAVVTRGLELAWSPRPLFFLAAAAGSAALAVVAGLAASVGALAWRPIEVLRSE